MGKEALTLLLLNIIFYCMEYIINQLGKVAKRVMKMANKHD
jgi:hypothetical protein